jgi:nitrate/TMAO reductase-like tetraheme cytochrome c subunit
VSALIAAVAAVLLAAVTILVIAPATDRSAFCDRCHEMSPYYDAWAAGGHKTVECVECHVAPGRLNRLAHKWVALGEVRSHLFGDPRFPLEHRVEVPDDHCVRCHKSVRVKTAAVSRFSHREHETKAQCWECHVTTGHSVSLNALEAAGALASNATTVPASVVGSASPRPRPGHIAVSCTRCHDQSRTPCATCHRAPHVDRGSCDRCHRPGRAFAFTHPIAGDCAGCHKPKHPARGTCTLCHRVGKTWTFHHPADKACAKCHKPPANHFGPDCARCHKPSVPFARTRFDHPSTGAPHGYTSFPCKDCHPASPPAVSCTCHGGGRPSGD